MIIKDSENLMENDHNELSIGGMLNVDQDFCGPMRGSVEQREQIGKNSLKNSAKVGENGLSTLGKSNLYGDPEIDVNQGIIRMVSPNSLSK